MLQGGAGEDYHVEKITQVYVEHLETRFSIYNTIKKTKKAKRQQKNQDKYKRCFSLLVKRGDVEKNT